MQIRSLSWCALLVTALMACGSRQQSREPVTSAPVTAHAEQSSPGRCTCPMAMNMANTQITTADTTDGIAIVFATTGDVADLRARVRKIADMHNRMAGEMGSVHGEGAQGGGMQAGGMQGDGMHCDQGGGMHGMGMGAKLIPSRASVEDVPGGARLVLVPADASQLEVLRQQARMWVEMMQRGQCPMMSPPPTQIPVPDESHDQHHPTGA